MEIIEKDGKRYKVVYTPYITRKDGKRQYHPQGKLYRFEVELKD
ncbi:MULTISPECIES: hypothetical protein [unclassified Sphingobacterium]|nr:MULTISPECIES: hypothetical protein [unclassified Sphingobacterium]